MKSNKIFAATAAAVLALSVLFTGCAQAVKYEPTESGVFVKRDGSVTGASIESFDKDYYNADELTAYVEKQVVAYNSAHSDYDTAYASDVTEKDVVLPVAINKLAVEEGVATLLLDYASLSDYLAFNENAAGSEYFETCIATLALTASSDVNWIKAQDHSSVTQEEALSSDKMYFVGLDFAAQVMVQGKIVYASENVSLINDNTFSTDGEKAAYVVYKK